MCHPVHSEWDHLVVTQGQHQHQLLFPAAHSNACHHRLALIQLQSLTKITLNLRNDGQAATMVMLIHQKIIWGLIQLAEVNDIQSHVGVSCGCCCSVVA